MGDWSFDPAAWPDVPGMMAQLEAWGMRVMVSAWPFSATNSSSFGAIGDQVGGRLHHLVLQLRLCGCSCGVVAVCCDRVSCCAVTVCRDRVRVLRPLLPYVFIAVLVGAVAVCGNRAVLWLCCGCAVATC